MLRWRRAIAIDETKVKLEREQVFVWNAIDIDAKEIIGVYVSKGRCSIDTLRFMRRVLMYCEKL
jgi:transposase-like protein